jgi:hypothetical protein
MTFNMADFLEAMDAPDWLTHNSTWIFHIPMSAVFVKLLRPRTFVELGTFRGDSYMGFCQAIAKMGIETRCSAVDTWEGDEHAGHYGPGVYLDLQRHHDPRYGRFSRLMKMDFDSASREFADNSIDLLHIDGLHTYEAVKHDFETWLPKLTDRAVVLFHDTVVRDRDFGVWKLWEEISAGRPNFNVPYGCGLGILAVGRNVPAEFLGFLEDLNAHADRILPQFIALGRRNELMRTCMIQSAAIHDCQAVVNEWRKFTGQPIRNATPDRKRAWDDPAGFTNLALKDVSQMAADCLTLMREVTELRKAAKRDATLTPA